MKHLVALVLALSFVAAPFPAEAAAKPSVKLVAPEKKAEYGRADEMPVSWTLKNVTRDMVVLTTVKLVKRDTKGPGVGVISGSTYQHVVHAGDTTGGFTIDWGANDTIPGKYSILLELRECNEDGCNLAPAGKKVGKSKKHLFMLTRGESGGATSTGGTTLELISPDGDESYLAGSGKTVKVKWEADGVPKGSKVCVLLEKKGGGFFSFPPCKNAKDGKGSLGIELDWNAGFDLGPGEYWVHIDLGAKPSGGKDGGSLAHDVSEDTITLR